MILDTSAIIALPLDEPDAPRLFAVLNEAQAKGVGAPTLVETGLVLSAKLGTQRRLHRFVQEFGVTVIPFGDPHGQTAVLAFERYGRADTPPSSTSATA